MKIFAVAGDPILHSRSPRVFAKLFPEAGVDGAYFRLLARNVKEVSAMVRGMDLDGINVTSPFKVDLLPHLDEIEPPASEAGAVNCVYRRGGKLVGANTDYIGVIKTIRAHGITPEGRKAVVFGAGGAARAAIYALVMAGAAKVTIINRTPERARAIGLSPVVDIPAVGDSDSVLKECDICLSCLPGPGPLTDFGILKDGCLYMSASYKDTVSHGHGGGRGPILVDGREWLIYQAGPAFKLMTGAEPPGSFPDREAWELAAASPERKPNIALIGFSGTGKTSTGKILAAGLGYQFADTDALVETRTGLSIPAIFRRLGEGTFREAEKEVIAREVPAARNTVFAVGGGAVVSRENADIIRRHCLVIWLWASPRVSLGRIKDASRPLLDYNHAEDRAKELLVKRIPDYARIAYLALSSEDGPAKVTAKRIQNEMDQAFRNQG